MGKMVVCYLRFCSTV